MGEKLVAVTGAHGFIGGYVARHYSSQGWRVIGIGHGQWSRHQWEAWGIDQWYECDINISNLASFIGTPDVIVHCAGSGSVRLSVDNPIQDFERTVQTTQAVLEYIRLYSPSSKMIYPSSAAVYGASVQMPTPENSLLKPISPYGVHKKIAEEICSMYAAQYGVSVAIIRLFSVYGAGLCKQLLWDACRKLDIGEKSFYGTGLESRDWVHVKDIAALLYIAHEKANPTCPIVNGGSGAGVSIKEILSVLFRYYGRADEPLFMGNIPNGDPLHYRAEITLAQQWGWQAKLGLMQGIREYVEWYKQVTE